MKTMYIVEKGKMTERKIRKIVKKARKISKKEEIVIAICEKYCKNYDLLKELESNSLKVLDRKLDFWIFAF